MENLELNKKNKKPVISRVTIDILENKIKELLYEREVNSQLYSQTIQSDKLKKEEMFIMLDEKGDIIDQHIKHIEKLNQDIEKLQEKNSGHLDNWKFYDTTIKHLKQEIEKLKEENKLVNQNAEMLLQEMVANQKEEVKEPDGWFEDNINEDIEEIIKDKEKEDNKVIDKLKEDMKYISECKLETEEKCETLKEENKALRTYIRENGIAKAQVKIKQLNEEITFLRTQCMK